MALSPNGTATTPKPVDTNFPLACVTRYHCAVSLLPEGP